MSCSSRTEPELVVVDWARLAVITPTDRARSNSSSGLTPVTPAMVSAADDSAATSWLCHRTKSSKCTRDDRTSAVLGAPAGPDRLDAPPPIAVAVGSSLVSRP